MAPAVTRLQAAAERHGLTLTEVAYRWLQWHSKMIPEDHGIIVGASTVQRLETAIAHSYVKPRFPFSYGSLNYGFSSKGPLPSEVVQACEKTWLDVKGIAKDYWLDESIIQTASEIYKPHGN